MNYKQALQQMRIIHMAIVFGLCVIMGVSYLSNTEEIYVSYDMKDPMVLVVPLIVMASILGSKQLFKSLVNAKKDFDLSEKITHYRTASIVRLAIMEMGAMIGVVAFVMSPNLFFLICAGLSLIYMLALFPRLKLIAKELELDRDEYYEFTK